MPTALQQNLKSRHFLNAQWDINILLSCTHAGRSIYAKGYSYGGEPILITECGGINYNSAETGNWGYTSAAGEEDFLLQYDHVIRRKSAQSTPGIGIMLQSVNHNFQDFRTYFKGLDKNRVY